MLFETCKACNKKKLSFLIKKRGLNLEKRDLNGKIVLKEYVTSQNRICRNCAKNISKMLNQ